jgi:GntR family transcriptional regulator/MocR family aminotransferase
MRRIYGARREVLLSGLQAEFSRWLEPVPSVAGLHLTALAKVPMDLTALVASAREREVGVQPVDRFRLGKGVGTPGLVFGYGALDERGIVAGLARLRRVFGK